MNRPIQCLLLFLTLVTACVTSACTDRNIDRKLDAAEAIIEDRPDSALQILNAVTPSAINTARSKARYWLLTTQAKVKNDVSIPSDSAINISVDYYERHNDLDRRMKSLFYQAQVRYYLGKLDKAIVPATEARELAVTLTDHYWQAKAAELIADIYAQCYLHDRVLMFTQETVEQYELAGKERNKLFALANLGVALYNYASSEDSIAKQRGIHLIDSVYSIACHQIDSLLICNALESRLYMLVKEHNVAQANKCLEELTNLKAYYYSPAAIYASEAMNNILSGDTDSAIESIRKAENFATDNSEKAYILDARSQLYSAMQDHRNLAIIKDSLLSHQNATVHQILRQSVITALHEKSINENLLERRHSNVLTMLVMVMIILFSALIISMIFTFKYKTRLRKEETEQYLEKIDALNVDMEKLTKLVTDADNEKEQLSKSIKEKEQQIYAITKSIKTEQSKWEIEREFLTMLEKKDKESMTRENKLLHKAIAEKDILLDTIHKKEQLAETLRQKERLDEDIRERKRNEKALRDKVFLEKTIKEKEALEQELKQLSKNSIENLRQTENIGKEAENNFWERWGIIVNLCNEYMEKGNNISFKEAIPKTLKKEIDQLKKTETQKTMTSLVDKYLGNIISLLKKEGDFILNENDEILFTLIFVGFSNKTISLLTGINLKTIYTKRYRLKEKIASSEAPHKDFFLSKLNI